MGACDRQDRGRIPGKEPSQRAAQRAGKHEVRESDDHGVRSCSSGSGWDRGRLAANSLIRGGETFIGTHSLPEPHEARIHLGMVTTTPRQLARATSR